MCKYKRKFHQHHHWHLHHKIHQVSEYINISKIIYLSLELSHYIAIFPYEAQQDDELSFPADAVLEIIDQVNSSGWFKARLGDQVGLIPSTYVQPADTHN